MSTEPALGNELREMYAQESARLEKDFATSDLIRDRLKELGINVMDTKDGTTWERS